VAKLHFPPRIARRPRHPADRRPRVPPPETVRAEPFDAIELQLEALWS
jgi:hypothetical protein